MDPSKDKYCLVETQMAVSLSQLIAPEQMSWWSPSNDGQTSNLQTHRSKTTAAVERRRSVCWMGRAPRDGTHAQALTIPEEGQRRPVLFWQCTVAHSMMKMVAGCMPAVPLTNCYFSLKGNRASQKKTVQKK